MSGRRQHGEGSIRAYTTKAGERYRIEWYQTADPSNADSRAVRRSRRGYATKKEAATALRRILIDVQAGKVPAAGQEGVTVDQYATEWLSSRRIAATTRAGYEKIMRLHVVPHLGDRKIKDLRPRTLAGLYRTLEAAGTADGGRLGANSVKKVHSLLSTMLQAAVEDGLLPTDPAKHSRAEPPTEREIKTQRPEIEVWDEEQIERFLTWSADNSGSHAAWVTLLGTGLRRGELLGLRWGDLDLNAGTLAVRRAVVIVPAGPGRPGRVEVTPTKNARDRVLTIDNDVLTALREHRSILGRLGFPLISRTAPIFGDETGHVMYPETLSKRWRSDVAAARKAIAATLQDPAQVDEVLPTLHLHATRHSHLTMLILDGVPAKIVQTRAGHQSLGITTQTYAHVRPRDENDAMRAWAERRTERRNRAVEGDVEQG